MGWEEGGRKDGWGRGRGLEVVESKGGWSSEKQTRP